MALSNKERQARFRQRQREASQPAWIRKDFESSADARETLVWFREFFATSPIPHGAGLAVYSQKDMGTGAVSLLVHLPFPLTETERGMRGWRLAREDATDLGHWQVEVWT
ncbi:hypothetical protein [Novosphingobium cyanobacteriorum]|uniref:Uncharacterized protein n=1 Tax=Novosphingobium cyanobacteriorum TaxID=3024215 RepID=A0ABT6CK65_9SPHN|nr:hypothetical protein [Novosphingobium cyanobacteriorum]MDF8333663.1 hypothetical protein [Novosphingobium cyanobacteriorum]